MKNLFVAFVFLVGLSSCSTSTIYIVRHADRLDKSEDSPLSTVGFARAQALKDSLQFKRIDSVFVTQYRRTRQTADPLMSAKNLNAVVYPPHPTTVIVNRLQRLKGKNALVVGHSDTILEIAKGLGTTPTKTKIESTDYDNLLIVTLKRGLFINSKTLQEKRFGVETN
ncbi:MAG: histidine phosphatase family protein [Spirosomaceae bacterium]|jgi:broad specificity phosphatase PhoE|nr:histidine phosphatase family protein [Spirosomataceae bacterium]